MAQNPDRTEFTKRSVVTGIVPTEDGTFVSVTFRKRSGSWSPGPVRTWPMTESVKSAITLSRGVVLGITSDWVRNGTDNRDVLFTRAESVLKSCADSKQSEIYTRALSGSLIGVVPDDAFLLTLPLMFTRNAPESFISVFQEGKITRIGVVTNKKLQGVFVFPCSSSSEIQSFITRIRRYWKHVLKRGDFPQTAFTFDKSSPDTNYDGIPVEPVSFPEEIRGANALRAAGSALAILFSVPAYTLSPEDRFSRLRPTALKITLLLLIAGFLLSAVPTALNFISRRELVKKEEIYNTYLKENQDIRRLNRTAVELSDQILSVKETYSRMSNWGKLFQLLGITRPQNLYFDRFASDQISGSQKIRIILTGWSQSETSVTDFISKIESAPFIRDASLSSMERDLGNKNICRFKILCIMDLYEN
ncbi:MAG: PilN domain-containing protein [Chitinispirillaceae bacterium]